MSSRGKWTAHVDDSSGQTYYYNAETGESRWTAPGWINRAAGEWYHEETGETRNTDPAWQVFYDDVYNAPYWFNAETEERTWEKPAYAIAWTQAERRATPANPTITITAAAAAADTPSRAGRIAAARANRADGASPNFRRSIAVHALAGGSTGESGRNLSMFDVLSEQQQPKFVTFQRPPTPSVNMDSLVSFPTDISSFSALAEASRRPIVPAGLAELQQRAVQFGSEKGAEFIAEDVETSALAAAYARSMSEYKKRFLSQAALSKLAFFGGMTTTDVKTVANAFTLWICPSGTAVATCGDLQDCLYVVAKGQLQLYSREGGGEDLFRAEHCGLTTVVKDKQHIELGKCGPLVCGTLEEGDVLGAAGLVAENARFKWSAVSVAGGDDSDLLSRCLGGCHLLVLSRASLYASIGHQWLLNRRLSLLTGIQGPAFAAQHSTIWQGVLSAATFAGASAGTATTALLRGVAGVGTDIDAANSVGSAVSSSVSLISGSEVSQACLSLLLTDVPVLSTMEPARLLKFSRHCVLVRKRAHVGLLLEGHLADAFVLVLHGAVRVSKQNAYTMTAGPGFFAGEKSLLEGVPCNVTVATASECVLLLVPRSSWDRFIRRNEDVKHALADQLGAVVDASKPWKELKVFSALTATQLGSVASACRVTHLHPGQKLHLYRRRTEGCYIVARGAVDVTLEDLSTRALPGRVVGLHNILSTSFTDPIIGETDAESRITMEAAEESVLIRITRSDLMRVIGGLDAAVSIIGNFEGSGALLAALANEAAIAEGLPRTPSDVVLYDVASISVLARCKRMCTIIESALQMESKSASLILQFVQDCDAFTQRAVAISPTGSPIVFPSTSLFEQARAVYDHYLADTCDETAIRDIVPELVRESIKQFLTDTASPAALTSTQSGSSSTLNMLPVTMFADALGAIDVYLAKIIAKVRDSMATRQLIENIVGNCAQGCTEISAFLDAESAAGHFNSTAKKGMVARFIASKLNRYGRWQGRVLTVRLDNCDVIVHETAGEASHRFKLTSISSIQRNTRDLTGKQLSLFFHDEVDKDYNLKFEDSATRETFCMLVSLLEPRVPVTDDCVHIDSAGRISYDVMLVTRGVNSRRTLILDTARRLLIRAHPDSASGKAISKVASSIVGASGAGSIPEDEDADEDDLLEGAPGGMSKGLAITVATRLEPSLLDPLRLKLVFGSEGDTNRQVFEVFFSNPTVREHFASTLRLLTWGADPSVARCIGLNRSGVAPDVLSVFTGTFNVGEQKPPKDLSVLSQWIPAHRYDVFAIGFQECNARDEWVKAIEHMLHPANAPSSSGDTPVFSSTGTVPAPAPVDPAEPAKDPKHDSKSLFSRLRGKPDKSDAAKELSPSAKGIINSVTPAEEPANGLQLSDPIELLGFKRDAVTGAPTMPTHAVKALNSSSSSLAKFSAEPAQRVSSKATRMLGLGGSAPSTPTSKPGTLPGVPLQAEDRRPDPPVSPSPYALVSAVSLWNIHLVIFARATVAEHISNVQTSTEATGIGGVLGNKGGVACGFLYKEATSFAFVTAHLAARPERQKERGENYAEICKNLRLITSSGPGQFLHQFNHIFFFGDLNYRIDLGNMGSPEEFARVQQLVAAKDFASLVAGDQLIKELETGKVFAGFCEGRIQFWPTYRLEKGREEYSNKRFQNPSYTDRVLWRSRGQADIMQLYYDATFSINISDHRPVGAGFLVSTQVPYLNLDRIETNTATQKNSTSISLCYLRYDDVVLSRSEQLQAAAGIDVSDAVGAVQKSRARVMQSSTEDLPASEWGSGPSALTFSAGDGALGNPASLPSYVSASAVASPGIEVEGYSSLRADDYYVELSANFVEDVTTSVGQSVGTGCQNPKPQGTQLSNSALAAAVSGSSVLTALAAAMESPVSQAGGTAGSLSAEWGPESIPDLIAQIADIRWLQDQCLLATLRRKGGAIVAQGQIPLADAYACVEREMPLGAGKLSLSVVLDHPLLARMFTAYANSRLSGESIDLYRATLAYQELCASGELATPSIRLVAAHSIADTFVWSTAARMVSVPGTLVSKLRNTLATANSQFDFVWHSASAAEAVGFNSKPVSGTPLENVPADMFSDIAAEVFKAMERELMPGFRSMYASLLTASGLNFSTPSSTNHREQLESDRLAGKAVRTSSGCTSAPFAIPMLKDGCVVGLLRGGLMLSSLDALGERSERLRELQRFLRRRSSVHKMSASGAHVHAGPTVALEEAPISAGLTSRIGNMLFGAHNSSAQITAPVPALHLNNIANLIKLPTGDQVVVKQLVDQALGRIDHASTTDDFLLLADIVMGSAIAEHDASAGTVMPGTKSATTVLQRAASMAIGASSGDKSLTTRALRMVLQLALQRLTESENQLQELKRE